MSGTTPTGSQADPAGLIGRSLGDFVIREKLGEGGFGAVYRAEQVHLAREAVIKVLRDRHQADARIIERFKREAHLASALEHPYTAHIYAFGAEHDGLLWIAMELVRGTPMDRILSVQGAIPLERFVPLLDKICQVVQTAHEHGIVHRDLKPANVMVISRAGRLLPKLLDFGIAKGLVGPLANSPQPRTHAEARPKTAAQPMSDAVAAPNGSGRAGHTAMLASSAAEALAETGSLAPPPPGAELATAQTLAGPLDAAQAVAQAAAAERLAQGIAEYGESPEADRLTVGVMGSPHYMAPEQWMESGAAGASTDIYALGVLSYEALTGRPPFRGTLAEVCAAHRQEPVPPLGASFPVALDAVLARAMAKRREERYQTALEFGAAFRDAAGTSEESVNLPALDEALSTLLMSQAPRPLAQVVAALRAARNLHQARDRMVDVARVAMRYVGLLSLACCSHTGGSRTDDVVQLLVRKLRHEGLGAAEWGRLGRELCRPFVLQRYAHPVPELVSLFFPEGPTPPESPRNAESPRGPGELPGTGLTMAALAVLREFKEALFNPAQSEEQLRDLMGQYLAQLATILRQLAFLSDYQLVVPRGADLEIWMGTGQPRVRPAPPRHRIETGRPVLVDSDGVPVLSLWPLIQAGEPTPGAPLELFLFEGKGRHGARLVAMPAGFERHDDAPWQWFHQHFFALDDEIDKRQEVEEVPYLGLTSFSPAQAGIFFGREKEAVSALNRLRVQPLLAVVGPSGAGKSSFVQAGIVPGLPQGTQVLTVRPGTAPASSLIARLAERGVATAGLEAALAEGGMRRALPSAVHFEALGVALRAAAEALPAPAYLVLVIDQFEELFTLGADPRERRLYGEWLARAARSADDRVRILLSLRDDFLVRAKELSGLSDRLTQGLELLTTPVHEDLVRILVEPARRFGYEFDDPELPEEMARTVEGLPGALPLLAFTAAKLWELRDRQFRQLLRSAHEGMGGVGGALARHAEEMLGQMPREEQRLVREAFRRLVTSEGTRAVLTGPEFVQVLGGTSEATHVIEKLVRARLLIASEGDGGLERIEVVHEALLSAWPRLVQWRSEDAEGARLRDQLGAAARQWHERGRPSGLLWRDEAWIEFQLWRTRYQGKLTELEEAFASASQSQASRTRWRQRALISLSIGALILVILIVNWQRDKTRRELLSLYEEQGRQELLAGHPDRAIVYLSASYSGGNDSVSLRYLLGQAMQQFDPLSAVSLVGHRDRVHSALFSPDGKTLLTASADRTAKRWDAASGQLLGTLEGHDGALTRAAFSPDGQKIVTASLDRTARIWDTASGRLLTTIAGAQASIADVTFTPRGREILTADFDGRARVFDAASGQLLLTFEGHRGSVNAVAISPDSECIATAGNDGAIKLWSRSSGLLIQSLTGHLDAVHSVAFSPDGSLLVTASADGTAKLWDSRTGALQASLEGHSAIVYSAVFSPNGTRIVTASADRKVKVWDAQSGKLLADLGDEAAPSFIHGAAFSPDGRQIVTAGYDHTARLWDVALETRSAAAIRQIVASRVPFILDGERLIANPRVAPAHAVMAPSSTLALRTPFTPAPRPTLETYEFETLRLGERGEKLGQRKLTARYFSEDLGAGVQLDMVLIPPGTFLMGSPPIERDRNETSETQHPVTVRSFYMSKYEVTQLVWRAVMGTHPSKYSSGDTHPVDAVSWFEAMEFCERLSQRTGKLYRLPSEAEWEYACRAGTTTPFAFGETITTEFVNFDGNYAYGAAPHGILRNRTIPAGSLGMANAFGLYEMHGNVWEWCLDWYHGTYQGAPTDGSAWEIPTGQARILRGGSWDNGGLNSRCANRNAGAPVSKVDGRIGFRVVAVQ